MDGASAEGTDEDELDEHDHRNSSAEESVYGYRYEDAKVECLDETRGYTETPSANVTDRCMQSSQTSQEMLQLKRFSSPLVQPTWNSLDLTEINAHTDRLTLTGLDDHGWAAANFVTHYDDKSAESDSTMTSERCMTSLQTRKTYDTSKTQRETSQGANIMQTPKLPVTDMNPPEQITSDRNDRERSSLSELKFYSLPELAIDIKFRKSQIEEISARRKKMESQLDKDTQLDDKLLTWLSERMSVWLDTLSLFCEERRASTAIAAVNPPCRDHAVDDYLYPDSTNPTNEVEEGFVEPSPVQTPADLPVEDSEPEVKSLWQSVRSIAENSVRNCFRLRRNSK